jgi:hypothetical protein
VIQDPKAPPPSLGVVYNTSMTRPDAALALAALYAAAGKREARVNGICITGSGFDAAVFCDIVARFYTGTARAPSSNAALPIGFPAGPPMPPNPPMVEAAINRKRPDGQPQYARAIQRVTDTAAPDALLRNAITFSADTVVVLSAPATWLARSLALAGTPALYRQHVKRIVVVESDDLERDASAAKALVAALPFPAVSVGRDIGQALAVPVSRVQGAFAKPGPNPVADAIAAAGGTQIPLLDVAALHYAVHPEAGFFAVSGGRLVLDLAQKEACLEALLKI